MEDSENIIDVIEEEKNEEFSNDDLFNITSWGADPSVRELIMQYEEGDIEKPELQRKYLWTKKTASRFVESLLLGLPVPSIFLANNEVTGKRLIVDGYQRLRTLVDFISEGIWHGDDTAFRLVNSDIINVRWRGKTFKELSDVDKRRLKNYTIHAIIFEQKQPLNDSGMFQIFERINTGGMTLNDQEVRNCVYQGALNTLLFELNKNDAWRKLYGLEKEDTRMKDLELILRFFALNKESVYRSEQKSFTLKQLLNEEMAQNIKDSDHVHELGEDFKKVIEFIYENFGEEAFFNLQNDLQKMRKRLYPTVYDSLMIATSIALRNGYTVGQDDLRENRLQLLRDEEYRESITQGTMQTGHINTRISKALSIVYGMEL